MQISTKPTFMVSLSFQFFCLQITLILEFSAHMIWKRNNGWAGNLSGNIANAVFATTDTDIGGIVVLLGQLGFGGQQFPIKSKRFIR